MSKELDEAIGLIKAGDNAGARQILVEILKANPKDDKAWVYMAVVVEPKLRRECLEEALKHNPRNRTAARALEKMPAAPGLSTVAGQPEKPKKRKPKWQSVIPIILFLGLGSVCLLIPLTALIPEPGKEVDLRIGFWFWLGVSLLLIGIGLYLLMAMIIYINRPDDHYGISTSQRRRPRRRSPVYGGPGVAGAITGAVIEHIIDQQD